MDAEDIFAKRPDDPLSLLGKQDLDPLSVEDLNDRIARLEAEILRVRGKVEKAVNHRATADAIFKR